MGVDFGEPHFDHELEELGLLAQTAGFVVADRVTCKRRAPDPALFVGSGKAEEIRCLVAATGATEVLFDQALSPAQQRNLERYMGVAVNDRTLLILEIFAQRARSHEGKLQVELARMQYLSTRLVRRWSHLERQRGGVGHRGGPGETQIELDRRMLSDALQQARKWSADTEIRLGGKSAETLACIGRWFHEAGASEAEIEGTRLKLLAGFKKITASCNSGKVIFSDRPHLRASGDYDNTFASVNAGDVMPVIYIYQLFLDTGKRIDGRDTRTVRPIEIRNGVLPRTHGSALFTRGETQALVIATLGTDRDGPRSVRPDRAPRPAARVLLAAEIVAPLEVLDKPRLRRLPAQ